MLYCSAIKYYLVNINYDYDKLFCCILINQCDKYIQVLYVMVVIITSQFKISHSTTLLKCLEMPSIKLSDLFCYFLKMFKYFCFQVLKGKKCIIIKLIKLHCTNSRY